jgi:RNA polymerase sigma-70 factor (sigma-E family)
MMALEVVDERAAKGRLAELYRRHAPAAARLAFLLTGDRTLAEDLVQEAFVRLAGRFVDMRNPDAFEAYLRRTVVNLTNSHFRRLRVERAYLERQRQAPVDARRPFPDLESRDELWQALQLLNVRQRAAIVLRFYEDLSEREIAEVLECPPGTVKSLISRGMDALRGHVRGDQP